MAERNALLYLSIARRCAQRGETGRAIITIVNAFQAHPKFIEQHTESVEFLAEILIPGCEEDLNRLEARHPVFGTKLRNALFAQGKIDEARKREENFNNYCIARMKAEHYDNAAYMTQKKRCISQTLPPSQPRTAPQMAASQSIMTAAVPNKSGASSDCFPSGREHISGNASERAFFSRNADFRFMTPNSHDGIHAVPRGTADRTTFAEIYRDDQPPQYRNDAFDDTNDVRYSDGHDDFRLMTPNSCCAPGTVPPCAVDRTTNAEIYRNDQPPQYRNDASDDTNNVRYSDGHDSSRLMTPISYFGIGAVPGPDIPNGTDGQAFPSDRRLPVDARYQWAAPAPVPEGMPFFEMPRPAPRRHDTQIQGSGDNSHRFDRISINRTIPEAPVYADTVADRVILDFDNRIQPSTRSILFAPSQTKFRSFEEDLAWTREVSARRSAPRNSAGANPMEIVAETTHALTDTPSVEPYAARHPMRFSVTPRQILTCVILCVICVFALVIYRSAEPDIEKRAIKGVSASYISAAESGAADPMAHLPETSALIDPKKLDNYRLFLETWQALHFEGTPHEPVDPENGAFPADSAAAQAAYISQETACGNADHAKIQFEKIRDHSEIWHDHPYFKTWCEAQIDEASQKPARAASKYGQLLRTPLAPFALAQLGILAIGAERTRDDIRSDFLNQMARAETDSEQNTAAHIPGIALCARAVLERDKTTVKVPYIEHLQSPYDEYCAIGRIFSEISNGNFGNSANDFRDMALLKTAKLRGNVETSRIEALIMAELILQRPQNAAAYYRQIDLPENHPHKHHLQNAILNVALSYGDWSYLNDMFHVGHDVSLFGAAHIIDAVRHMLPVTPPGFRESIFQYGGSLRLSPQTPIEEAYEQAIDGRYEQAVRLTRDILNTHPQMIEPVLLQTLVFSHARRNAKAAAILEQSVRTGTHAIAYVIYANAFRARAGMPLAPNAAIIPYISFSDPVTESARCEILWRTGDPRARSCIRALNRKKNDTTRAAWIMAHLSSPNARPSGTAAQWAKAGMGMLSFPGYHLAYARVLRREGQIRAAAKQYTHAIIDDDTTASVKTIEELEKLYAGTGRRYESTHLFESIIRRAEKAHIDPELIATLHLSAARLYQPKSKNSQVKIHLLRALDILGDRPEILRGFVAYYEAKDKPENAAKWRARLRRAVENANTQP